MDGLNFFRIILLCFSVPGRRILLCRFRWGHRVLEILIVDVSHQIMDSSWQRTAMTVDTSGMVTCSFECCVLVTRSVKVRIYTNVVSCFFAFL